MQRGDASLLTDFLILVGPIVFILIYLYNKWNVIREIQYRIADILFEEIESNLKLLIEEYKEHDHIEPLYDYLNHNIYDGIISTTHISYLNTSERSEIYSLYNKILHTPQALEFIHFIKARSQIADMRVRLRSRMPKCVHTILDWMIPIFLSVIVPFTFHYSNS